MPYIINIYSSRSAGWLPFSSSSLGSAVPDWTPDSWSRSHLSAHGSAFCGPCWRSSGPHPAPQENKPNQRSPWTASAHESNIPLAKPGTPDVVGKYVPHQGRGCAIASQDGVQTQGQHPNLPWPHSSQVAEPGGEPGSAFSSLFPVPATMCPLLSHFTSQGLCWFTHTQGVIGPMLPGSVGVK